MIRKDKKLPTDVMARIPTVIETLAADEDVVALYAFGSVANGTLKPLSDLDFAVLLSEFLDRQKRFDKSIELIGIFTEMLKTDEVDLVILNDNPLRFAFQILKTGKLFFCRDREKLVNFIESTTKRYLDFKPARDRFDRVFLDGVGYHG
jgi:predicted nucleotidyltransferase